VNYVQGVAVDAIGNVFLADSANHRIRKVDAAGIIVTVAGTGDPGFSGDGGQATEARLDSPADVAVGPGGALYIADWLNRRIRRVDSSGVITTVAGRAVPNDPVSSTLDTAGVSIGDGGPATAASLSYPLGVAVDDVGAIYISDTGHNRIRRVDPLSGVITSVAGFGLPWVPYLPIALGDGGPATRATLNLPGDVTLDGQGNIFIADRFNYRVRKVDAVSQIITTVAGNGLPASLGDGGPATHASINGPVGLSLDSEGSLWIADYYGHRVRRVDRLGIISTVAGTGEPGYSGDN
jgi:hypothetical protein